MFAWEGSLKKTQTSIKFNTEPSFDNIIVDLPLELKGIKLLVYTTCFIPSSLYLLISSFILKLSSITDC